MDSTEALEAFLQRNKLSHVIRAHEVKATGFQVTMHVVRWTGGCSMWLGELGILACHVELTCEG